jgi:flagellar basal body P-ring formation protein FlgA
MTRIVLLFLMPLALLVPQAFAHAAPMLKPSVSVVTDLVTIGDLVSDAGVKAEIPVFRAPDLGQTGSVAAADIVAAVEAHGLTVEPGTIRTVSVTRASRVVTAEEILAPLTEALAQASGLEGPDALAVEIDPVLATIPLSVEADGEVRIADAVWLKEQGRFEATLAVRRIDGVDERRPLTGTALETAAVVTAARVLERGILLTPNDLRIERKPKHQVRSSMIGDMTLAVGMEVRRTLKDGQAIRESDLTEPVLVKNGATVSIVLKSGSLTLTATGQALSDGKNGAAIQIMNIQSKRVLQAVVTGPDQVAVQAPRTITSVSAAK